MTIPTNATKCETTPSSNDPPKSALETVVTALCHGNSSLMRSTHRTPCAEPLPSRAAVIQIIEEIQSVLFPGYFGPSEISPETLPYHLGHTLDGIQRALKDQVKRGICFSCQDRSQYPQCDQLAREIVDRFIARLPALERLVASDVQAAFEGDPAATSPDEAIFCYPGVLAVTHCRIAHELHQLGVPLLPRMITEYAHSITGIDIHPGAQIGESFFIDHGTGVVIGETCIIGNHVRIYQGVTLGAKSFPLDQDGKPIKGIPRHPILEDDVIIYAGATILGRIVIGKGSVIGGNVWITRSLPPGSHVSQPQTRQDSAENGSGS